MERRWSVGGAIVVGLAVVAVLAAGVVLVGRLAGTAAAAAVLTGALFVLVGVVAIGFLRRRRDLLTGAAIGYGLAGIAVAVLLGLPALTDTVVDEEVLTAGTAGEAGTAGTPDAPTAVASGAFAPGAHPGSGTATLLRTPDGATVVTLTGFATDNGPDLRVLLAERAGPDPGATVDLGALKGNVGDQQYAVPAGIDPSRYAAVVVWCRAFSVTFTSAPLAPAAPPA